MASKKIGGRTIHRQKPTPWLFQDISDDEGVLRFQTKFIESLWCEQLPDHGMAFGFFAFKAVRTGRWIEKPIRVLRGAQDKAEILEAYPRSEYDQYFCPNLFSCAKRKAGFALPTRLGWCDMDDSNPEDYDPLPSLVWETSPGRYQALWAWDAVLTPVEAETYSRALAYRHGGDRNGWSVTKVLRLIGSINHKPHYDEPFVKPVHRDWHRIAERPRTVKRRGPMLPPLTGINPLSHSAKDVISRYRRYLHLEVRDLLAHDRVRAADRSACIYRIIAALHGAGADADEIASVLWRSPYFLEKHGQDMGKLIAEVTRVIGKLGGGK